MDVERNAALLGFPFQFVHHCAVEPDIELHRPALLGRCHHPDCSLPVPSCPFLSLPVPSCPFLSLPVPSCPTPVLMLAQVLLIMAGDGVIADKILANLLALTRRALWLQINANASQ